MRVGRAASSTVRRYNLHRSATLVVITAEVLNVFVNGLETLGHIISHARVNSHIVALLFRCQWTTLSRCIWTRPAIASKVVLWNKPIDRITNNVDHSGLAHSLRGEIEDKVVFQKKKGLLLNLTQVIDKGLFIMELVAFNCTFWWNNKWVALGATYLGSIFNKLKLFCTRSLSSKKTIVVLPVVVMFNTNYQKFERQKYDVSMIVSSERSNTFPDFGSLLWKIKLGLGTRRVKLKLCQSQLERSYSKYNDGFVTSLAESNWYFWFGGQTAIETIKTSV